MLHTHQQGCDIYTGVRVVYLKIQTEQPHLPHAADASVLEINHCRRGSVGWEMQSGNAVFLGSGDFSLHTMDVCADSALHFPNSFYEGITIYLDLNRFAPQNIEFLQGTEITAHTIRDKFCHGGSVAAFVGNEETNGIFFPMYDQPEHLTIPFLRCKFAELLLYLYKIPADRHLLLSEYQSEQVLRIREIHDYMMQHLDRRITVEMLSRQFLINTTTLKQTFKAVYGAPIAAHIKEHRMEKAAELLKTTHKSIAEIAGLVGYGSQSKFSAAFREMYQVSPNDYRK